ncbi:N-acetyltransferase [Photobacterium ganghwense]|uniref:GCN5 family acetyltransferase n=1 Tax=Photobacterium ganghwense TaxID=320778 RepID=A0A0J1HE96_9GAMM|nr:GNAT family N-acetyltransferase [Photobacterium ganghwense]KLV09933.1 GCN5 family acetyltransferase [Photobacterium ganghwense]PSU09219.1 N-acetyltransferase [Photobacterium ganghwense]
MIMETNRLILRQWKSEDYQPYAELCSDPHVMRYFLTTLSREESDEQANKFRRLITERGWGFWAVELKSTGQFIGFVGLHYQDENSGFPNVPFIEIGWRLSSAFWGQGYAPEAAQKALEFAFEEIAAPAVYAFTTLQNTPSQRVMLKLGMVNTHQDFSHPLVAKGHLLERHCLYQITKEQWLKKSK